VRLDGGAKAFRRRWGYDLVPPPTLLEEEEDEDSVLANENGPINGAFYVDDDDEVASRSSRMDAGSYCGVTMNGSDTYSLNGLAMHAAETASLRGVDMTDSKYGFLRGGGLQRPTHLPLLLGEFSFSFRSNPQKRETKKKYNNKNII
jgi:hypothetical protein